MIIPDATTQAISNNIVSDLEYLDSWSLRGRLALVIKHAAIAISAPPTAFVDSGNHATWCVIKLTLVGVRETVAFFGGPKLKFCAKELTWRQIQTHAHDSALFFVAGVISALSLVGTILSGMALCYAPFGGMCTPRILIGAATYFILFGATATLWSDPKALVARYRHYNLIKSEATWKKEKFHTWLKELPEKTMANIKYRVDQVWQGMKQRRALIGSVLVVAGVVTAIYIKSTSEQTGN